MPGKVTKRKADDGLVLDLAVADRVKARGRRVAKRTLSPSPEPGPRPTRKKRVGFLPLAMKRSQLIRDFKKTHPVSEYDSEPVGWTTELFEYVASHNHDIKLGLEDVEHWIQIHPWITTSLDAMHLEPQPPSRRHDGEVDHTEAVFGRVKGQKPKPTHTAPMRKVASPVPGPSRMNGSANSVHLRTTWTPSEDHDQGIADNNNDFDSDSDDSNSPPSLIRMTAEKETQTQVVEPGQKTNTTVPDLQADLGLRPTITFQEGDGDGGEDEETEIDGIIGAINSIHLLHGACVKLRLTSGVYRLRNLLKLFQRRRKKQILNGDQFEVDIGPAIRGAFVTVKKEELDYDTTEWPDSDPEDPFMTF